MPDSAPADNEVVQLGLPDALSSLRSFLAVVAHPDAESFGLVGAGRLAGSPDRRHAVTIAVPPHRSDRAPPAAPPDLPERSGDTRGEPSPSQSCQLAYQFWTRERRSSGITAAASFNWPPTQKVAARI
ncbi:MAG: hypothetical protein ACYCV7_07600 [Acidimicrobiales bacterium]